MKRLGLLPLLLLLGCEALWGRFNKPHFELAQASRSSTIAISQDDGVLVLVNPEHGSISIFEPTTLARTAVVPTGREPCSVVLHPDGDTAFVANRGDATVVKVVGLRSRTPQVVATAAVGSEPSGLALSPRGRRLFVDLTPTAPHRPYAGTPGQWARCSAIKVTLWHSWPRG